MSTGARQKKYNVGESKLKHNFTSCDRDTGRHILSIETQEDTF